MTVRRALAALLTAPLALAACSPPPPGRPAQPAPDAGHPAALPAARPVPPQPAVDTEPVFKTLAPPRLEGEAPYAFKEGVTVPPRPKTTELPFPPPAELQPPARPKVGPVGPLAVTRHQPEGSQGVAGAVSATFNQPMVPLASLADLKAHPVPLEVEPLPPGRFRWLGTSTVVFEPEGRLPFATVYTARIRAGTHSEMGGALAREVSWTFETPRVVMEAEPRNFNEALPDQLLHLTFNQAVSSAAVREALVCQAGGVRQELVASKPERDPFTGDRGLDVEARRKLFEERNVYLRPGKPLPLDASVTCTLPRGFKGAEGPLPTTGDQAFTFHTYAPLKVLAFHCGAEPSCQPDYGIAVDFNNSLGEQDLREHVKLKPDVPDLEVDTYGGPRALLHGTFAPKTTYAVTITAGLADVHGQKLAEPAQGQVKLATSDPFLGIAGAPNLVLERTGPRLVPVTSANLEKARLRFVRLQPGQLRTALNAAQRWYEPGRDPLQGFTASVDKNISLGEGSVGLAVDEALGAGKPGLLLVDLDADELHRRQNWESGHRTTVVQVTDLAITAQLTETHSVVLVTSLESGRPVAGATVRLQNSAGQELAKAQTDSRGIAELEGRQRNDVPPLQLLAEHGGDVAVLPLDRAITGETLSSYAYSSYNRDAPTVAATVFPERQPYRPGETVHLSGILRVLTHGLKGSVQQLPMGAKLNYDLRDARGQQWKHGELPIDLLGTFSLDAELPHDAALGFHSFQATLAGAGPVNGQMVQGSFQVQEFRTPEYEVSVDLGEPRRFVGEAVEGKVVGSYFFGGGMAGAQANWYARRSPGSFTPPGQTGYAFGDSQAVPWFGEEFGPARGAGEAGRGEGQLDGQGVLPFRLSLDAGGLTGPVSFTVEATVVDKNRQAIHASQTLLAHAGAVYPGLKLDRTVVKEGESVRASAIVADLDGKRRAPSGLKLELVSRRYERSKDKGSEGTWHLVEEVAGSCAAEWDGKLDDAASCAVVVPRAGEYALRVSARDEQGRENRSALPLYAYGKGVQPWFRPGAEQSVELVTDKAEYRPGETARVMIRSPFPHSVGLLAVEREGLISWRALDFEGSAHAEEVELSAEELPGVTLSVALVRGRIPAEEAGAAPGDPDDRGRPSYAGGTTFLHLSTEAHALTVSVSPAQAAVGPGEKVKVRLRTASADGRGVPAQVMLTAVDEGVLSLLGFRWADPLPVFFPERAAQGGAYSDVPLVVQRQANLKRATRQRSLRLDGHAAFGGRPMERLTLEAQPDTGVALQAQAAPADGFMAGDVQASLSKLALEPVTPLAARTNFATTAYFRADLQTDAQGQLDVEVPLPDNLTRYRLMAVAVGDGEHFGAGDGAVTVRKPLLVRPALPRFLNLGDAFLASAVINNQTDQDLWVDAQARVANGEVDAKRQRVLIRAGESTEVAFEAKAGAPGASRWQFAAVAVDPARASDAAELNVPVELPATVEAFATYGATEGAVLQPLQLPKDALPGFGALEVSLSSTALTGLTDAVGYLYDYPYECVEQTASRILPLMALKDVIHDFHLRGAGTEAERDKVIRAGIARILQKQRGDGGFGYWGDSPESYLYVSAWAGLVLDRAKRAGYEVDAGALARLESFLAQRLTAPRKDLGEDADLASQAMAALVLGRLGKPQPGEVRRIFASRKSLPIDGVAWLLDAAHGVGDAASEAELNRLLQSAAVEKASSVHFAQARTESVRLLMHSDERTDAIVLDALVHVRPKDPLVAKAAHGLNESRRHGRWDTTQSNAWATLAFADYYAALEKTAPNFEASIFVGNAFAGAATFQGRSTTTVEQRIPLAAAAGQRPELLVAKQGPGRMYYRLGLRYAPQSLKLAPEEQGFTISRTYQAMPDDPDGVTLEADGAVRIKAGHEVRVQLDIAVPDRAEFVAIDDPLPAGLEAVNLAFATNQSSRLRQAQENTSEATQPWLSRGLWARGWWWWSPFNHTEMHDDRVLLFADTLPAGVYRYTYVARATAKGTFQVPPARALEMYEPENFGRTGSVVVSVR